MRNKTKRLGALGATALVALVVIGPMSAVADAQETTTTGASTTTSSLPPQTTVHGSTANTNNCLSALDPPLQPGGSTKIGVTVSTDAFPQPHEGDQITLSNTKLSISIPAQLLQVGYDAGIIFDGQVIPSVVDFVINGSGTTQQTHHYTLNSSVTIHIVAGIAQPLTATLNLPNTKWTPVSINQDVHFSEKSLLITSSIDLSSTLGIFLTATFTCNPAGSAEFMALGGIAPPSTTTTVATTTTTVAPTTTPVTVQAPAPTPLPRTGSNASWLIALAVGLLTAGLFALKASGRRTTRSRS